MKEDLVSDTLLRKFLLAKVDADERQRIERLFVTGVMPRERVIAVEEHLIDDYLNDSLSREDKESFLLQYANTPSQQRKLRIAATIRDWAKGQANIGDSRKPRSLSLASLRQWIITKPFWVVPMAVAATVVIVVASVWSIRNSQDRRPLALLEQQVQQLNDYGSAGNMLARTSFTLSPVSVRSAERQPEVTARSEHRIVELRLLWMQKQQYPSFRAMIRRTGDNTPITIRNLKVEADGVTAVRLLLPAAVLLRGPYEIELNGVNAEGVTGASDEYDFLVTDQADPR